MSTAKMPEWYPTLRAARLLGLPLVAGVESIEDLPWYWLDRVLMADRAEAAALQWERSQNMLRMI